MLITWLCTESHIQQALAEGTQVGHQQLYTGRPTRPKAPPSSAGHLSGLRLNSPRGLRAPFLLPTHCRRAGSLRLLQPRALHCFPHSAPSHCLASPEEGTSPLHCPSRYLSQRSQRACRPPHILAATTCPLQHSPSTMPGQGLRLWRKPDVPMCLTTPRPPQNLSPTQHSALCWGALPISPHCGPWAPVGFPHLPHPCSPHLQKQRWRLPSGQELLGPLPLCCLNTQLLALTETCCSRPTVTTTGEERAGIALVGSATKPSPCTQLRASQIPFNHIHVPALEPPTSLCYTS